MKAALIAVLILTGCSTVNVSWRNCQVISYEIQNKQYDLECERWINSHCSIDFIVYNPQNHSYFITPLSSDCE